MTEIHSRSLQSAITKTFSNHNLSPREHQRKTIAKIIYDLSLRENLDSVNYLIAHTAGSGKTYTIACLVLFLLKLKDMKEKGFGLIIIVTDRTFLDSQVASVVIPFLKANGMSGVVHANSTEHLGKALMNPEVSVVITTLHKFDKLEQGRMFYQRRIAVIADEAHRSHGKSLSDKLHDFLVGNYDETEWLTYFSFTCTPGQHTLEMFGVEEGNEYVPFSVFSDEQAIKEKIILDVLEGFTYMDIPVFEMANPYMSKDEKIDAEIKTKAEFIVDHLNLSLQNMTRPNFSPKAMLVVSGRPQIIRYQHYINHAIRSRTTCEKIEVVSAFTTMRGKEGNYSENDESLNGKYHTDPVQSFLQVKSIKLIIVADKLQTGFDAPELSILYVDKVLNGPNAVQTLGRLSRVAPGKETTVVIDFRNTEDHIRSIFTSFRGRESAIEDYEHFRTVTEQETSNPFIASLINSIIGTKVSDGARLLESKLYGLKVESRSLEKRNRITPKPEMSIKSEEVESCLEDEEDLAKENEKPNSKRATSFYDILAKNECVATNTYVRIVKKRKLNEVMNTSQNEVKKRRRFKPIIPGRS